MHELIFQAGVKGMSELIPCNIIIAIIYVINDRANISDQVCVVVVLVCGLIVDSFAQLDL